MRRGIARIADRDGIDRDCAQRQAAKNSAIASANAKAYFIAKSLLLVPLPRLSLQPIIAEAKNLSRFCPCRWIAVTDTVYFGVKSASFSMPRANWASRSAAWSMSSSEIISTALCM